jgi:uncharacterized protein (TIGR03083 family)
MAARYEGIEPILCAPLLRRVDGMLIDLLSALEPREWDVQTLAPAWKAREVAAHLLDTALRKLSMARDLSFVETVAIRFPQDLAMLVNRLNREGVTVYRRLSPPVLIDLMRMACEQSADFHETLDPFARAAFAVTWAGEDSSWNWFDTARELTERWHHQQQIRFATDRPGIMIPELYHPVLDCFLRGLPQLYREVAAPTGTSILVEIAGDCGGNWLLSRKPAGWRFAPAPEGEVAAHVRIPQELAWRIFTKGVEPRVARSQVEITGDRDLGERVLQLTAIVA